MTLLVTGFAPYKEEFNASAAMIDGLMLDSRVEALRQRVSVAFEILSVDQTSREHESELLQRCVAQLIEKYDPRICIFTGQAPFRNKITIERYAHNRFMGQPIDAAGDACYVSTLPDSDGIVAALTAREIPASYSNDAGESLCNHILYTTLQLAARQGRELSAGFVHIPLMAKQVIAVPGYRLAPFMPTDVAQSALVHIIDRLVEAENSGARG